jgi:site-specific recombinase XerD
MIPASSAIPAFLDELRHAKRSKNTIKTYTQALRLFSKIIGKDDSLSEDNFIKFLQAGQGLEGELRNSAYVTYRVAVSRLYEYHAPGIPVKLLVERYGQKKSKRNITYNEDALEKLLGYCNGLRGDLRGLRDRAFVLTLADTGLRISEACNLMRADIDFQKARADIIGKGDKAGIIRFSARSLDSIRLYLSARSEIDGKSGKPLGSLPVFARHDPGAGKKIKRVGSSGMWSALADRIKEANLEPGSVTPHKFRHYFVTRILRAKNGNIAKAAEMARHEDINTTRRYTHLAPGEIDQTYDEVFNT